MTRRYVVRALTVLGVVACGFLALAGGVVLHGPYLLVLLIVAGLVGCVAFGVVEEGGRPAAAAGVTAAGTTVAVTMVVTGVGVLAGSGVAATFTLAAAAAGALGWLLKGIRRRSRGAAVVAPARPGPGAVPKPLPSPPDPSPLPVSLLPTPTLGTEWVRSTAALAGRLEPATRQEIVRRRGEALDELERRDPSGFARWLTADRGMQSDPAAFVRGHRTMGTDAA